MYSLTDYDLLLVKSEALPAVFKNVLIVKEMLARGEAASISEAIKKAGVSRSAYYKYKDCVFSYSGENDGSTMWLNIVLSNNAGKLSNLTAFLYKVGANILTVNQSLPVDGTAAVSIMFKTDNLTVELSKLPQMIKSIDGVISVKSH